MLLYVPLNDICANAVRVMQKTYLCVGALDLDTAMLSLALTVCFVIEPSPPGDVTPAYGSGKWWRSLSWCSMETREYI